jgi:hypothetical protein
MELTEIAIWICLIMGTVVSFFLTFLQLLMLRGRWGKEAQDRAHARRLAEARMDARLLRFDL